MSVDVVRSLDDLLYDIHALEDEIRSYERKFGMLSEIFYAAYVNGEEPEDDSWVRDWTAWAGLYQLWLQRRTQYKNKSFVNPNLPFLISEINALSFGKL